MKKFLILMTLVAVVSDYLLHPFYPQFFEIRFGVVNPKMVGYYFAAICFMVMISFPFWAYVAKRISELRILVYTQCIAGILAIVCYKTEGYVNFWIVSLIMILFKGSYLLVYPYVLRIVPKKQHSSTIGVLSVVVHLGGIAGAVIGGLVVDFVSASSIFFIMAMGDFIQMGMSIYLLQNKNYDISLLPVEPYEAQKIKKIPSRFVLKLGIVTLLLYYSDFLIRPFFSSYWEIISQYNSKVISGTMYAIPGFIALGILIYDSKKKKRIQKFQSILFILCIGFVGVLLQGIPIEVLVIFGRLLYGWAIFRGIVRFDVLLFEYSTPENYALDYSKVHFFQNLGVLLSSFSVGILVENKGLQMPFFVATIGIVCTLVLYYSIFKIKDKPIQNQWANT